MEKHTTPFGYSLNTGGMTNTGTKLNKVSGAKMNKNYYLRLNVGKAGYVVSFHDGTKTHKDGSPFYDIKIFSTRLATTVFMAELRSKGYKEL
jgi:hypothetical protein